VPRQSQDYQLAPSRAMERLWHEKLLDSGVVDSREKGLAMAEVAGGSDKAKGVNEHLTHLNRPTGTAIAPLEENL